MLKPGGVVLFRDFGRYDLCQLRFKKQRWMEENLYIRGDGTRVYFFTLEEIKALFQAFEEVELAEDRRLMLNRKRLIQMARVWLQGRFRKPVTPAADNLS